MAGDCILADYNPQSARCGTANAMCGHGCSVGTHYIQLCWRAQYAEKSREVQRSPERGRGDVRGEEAAARA